MPALRRWWSLDDSYHLVTLDRQRQLRRLAERLNYVARLGHEEAFPRRAARPAVLRLPASLAQELSAADLDRRRKALNDLLKNTGSTRCGRSPSRRRSSATSGTTTKSATRPRRRSRASRGDAKISQAFKAVDPTALPEQERLNRELMVRDLATASSVKVQGMEDAGQPDGGHPPRLRAVAVALPSDGQRRPGLHRPPRQVSEDHGRHHRQHAKGHGGMQMPLKILLVNWRADREHPPIHQPTRSPTRCRSRVSEHSAADHERLRTATLAAINRSVLPAYTKFSTFVRDEYTPKGRTDVGVWALPNGKARYAFRETQQTTTTSPPRDPPVGLQRGRAHRSGDADDREDGKASTTSSPSTPRSSRTPNLKF